MIRGQCESIQKFLYALKVVVSKIMEDKSDDDVVECGEFIFLDAYFEDRAIESLIIEYVPTSRFIGAKEKFDCLYQKFEIDKIIFGKHQTGKLNIIYKITRLISIVFNLINNGNKNGLKDIWVPKT